MGTPEEKFDGQIVNVATGEIEKCEARYYHHGITEIEPYQLLNRAENLRKRKMMGCDGDDPDSVALSETIFPELDAKIKALREEHGDQVVDAILESKLRMSFLLDTTGGVLYSSDARKKINDMIKSSGGKVDTYLKYAFGFSSEIFLQGDERIITAEAMFSPVFYKGSDEDFNEERNDDLIWSMTSKAPAEVRNELSNHIQEALENPHDDNAIVFNSAQMEKFGLATKVVGTIQELREEFLKRTGLNLLPDQLSSDFEKKLKAFFE